MNLENISVKGLRVLVRVDFNVPLNQKFEVTDNTRIVNALPTIKYLRAQGARIILLSHLGRPQKSLNQDGSLQTEKFSLQHLVQPLSNLLDQPVKFHHNCIGKEAVIQSNNLGDGDILLLENTRFHKGETKGSDDLANELSQLGEVYVNDAFGTAHRAHASTAVIAQFFDSNKKAFGFLMNKELENGAKILRSPDQPVVAILGGAKVSDKIELVKNLLPLADHICIGGGMAYTFKKALGGTIGTSLCEEDKLSLALELLNQAQVNGCTIHLPTDSMCASAFSPDAEATLMPSDEIISTHMGLDIGPQAIKDFSEIIAQGKTLLWNGPMGVFEFEKFSNGTLEIARAVATATDNGAYSLVGGGDSVSAINKTGLADRVSFISTGGGAMLELLEGKKLPGVAAME